MKTSMSIALGLLALSTAAAAADPEASQRPKPASDGAAGIRVLNADAHYPEGPVWYNGKLYYVEYDRNTVTAWDGKRSAIFATEKGCGQSAVIPDGHGGFLATCYDNGTIGRMSSTGEVLPAIVTDKDGNKFEGPNDFAPDAKGGIYFTDSGGHSGVNGSGKDGKVFYIGADGTVSLKAKDIHNANGIAVSKDGRILYVVETSEFRVVKFDIGADGTLSNQRTFVNLDDLTHHVVHIYPDGVKIDRRGNIYIGQSPRDQHPPLAGVIFVVNADAKLLRQLTLPSLQVPNFAFSPDEKTLYVTAVDQIDRSPYLGKIYAMPLP